MGNRRNLAIKICAIAFFLYLFIYIISSRQTSSIIRELQQSGRNLAALDPQPADSELAANQNQEVGEPAKEPPLPEPEPVVALEEVVHTTKETEVDRLERVRRVTNCLDRPAVAKTQQRGDYWVLYNYVKAERTFRCHESITYTTHADYTFMDNLVPLLERWRGPISIALHAPGTDFKNTMESISYLRECTSLLVKELVTFHIYFSTRHVPKEVSLKFLFIL